MNCAKSPPTITSLSIAFDFGAFKRSITRQWASRRALNNNETVYQIVFKQNIITLANAPTCLLHSSMERDSNKNSNNIVERVTIRLQL